MDINIMNTRVKVILTEWGLDILKEYYRSFNITLYQTTNNDDTIKRYEKDLRHISNNFECKFTEFLKIFGETMGNGVFVNDSIEIIN